MPSPMPPSPRCSPRPRVRAPSTTCASTSTRSSRKTEAPASWKSAGACCRRLKNAPATLEHWLRRRWVDHRVEEEFERAVRLRPEEDLRPEEVEHSLADLRFGD